MAGDLTQQLSRFLDRHLVFPLLEYLSNKHLYDDDDIQKAKISLLAHTNMVDYAMDIYATLYNTDKVPQDMKDRRSEVSAALLVLDPCMPLSATRVRCYCALRPLYSASPNRHFHLVPGEPNC